MSNSAQVVFVSGANRGIGYELVRQLSQQAYNVVAGYRSASSSQQLLDDAKEANNILPYKVDVTVESDLQGLYEAIAEKYGRLDIVINNAAINQKRAAKMNELDWVDIAHHFDVNVGSVFLATQYLYPLLKAGQSKKVINISSRLGSIGLNSGGPIPYNISKAGLNMLTKQQAIAYAADNISVLSISPGWVRTDMGGSGAPLSVAESVAGLLQAIEALTLEQSGGFVGLGGSEIPY